MYAAPLGSPAYYGSALAGLSRATSDVSASVARLSSGNRQISAGDDVAAVSIAARLRTQVVGLKAAQSNTSLGNSFLQVAYGGLTNIRDILEQMKALAVQANSASLQNSDRELLQQEFAALSAEVDRIAERTSFNGINLLDGTVSGENSATTETTQATQASGTLNFTSNAGAGDKVILNGVTFTAAVAASTATEFTIGGSIAATVTNLKTALNASTNRAISQASYQDNGTTLTVTDKTGGTYGNRYIIDRANSAAIFTAGGGATAATNIYTLQGGANNGLRGGSVVATGSIGDTLVNTQAQARGSVTLTLTDAVNNNETLTIDDGNGSVVTFTFKSSANAASSTEIQIGSTTEETLQNTVAKLSQYSGASDYGIRQLEFAISGNQLTLRNRVAGNPTDLNGAALDVGETITNGTLSATSFTNGSNTGVNVTGVVNADFVGTLDGFTATYTGADAVTASITVGSKIYSATISDTTPATNTTVRFSSTSGGYFDVQLASGGYAVGDQPAANTYAARLNAAFSTLSFYQSRNITSLSGTGGLAGATAEIQLDDFSDVQINDITVTAPSSPGSDATVEFTINGEIFRATSGIGGSLGKYETLTLTSIVDGNKSIRITNGGTVNSFDDATDAATFQDALRDSFGLNEDGTGLDFQVGTDTADRINVNIGDARTTKLFAGEEPAISDQNSAEDAQITLDSALNRVNQIISNVGALQNRFNAAFNNLESTRINVDIARGGLADTDIAEESTRFASGVLRTNATTAVLAQVRQLQSSLLDVLKSN